MEDDTSPEVIDSPDPSVPFMHVDYRVFEVTVEGTEDDSLEDLNEIMAQRLKEGMEDIEDLKRTDYNLESEFDADTTPMGAGGGMHQ